MTLSELLVESGIRRALVVDDGCDEVPTAADLDLARAEWTTFLDDLQESGWDVLARSYPGDLQRARRDQLQHEDDFVAAVWASRSELGGIADDLLREYRSNLDTDREYVQAVTDKLENLGVEVTTRGRDFVGAVADVDLVVIDLYLGASQGEQALATSKSLLAEAVKGRRHDPPLVILMSRSEFLAVKRDEFRDEVGLLDSGFRILQKADLSSGDSLERRLERLATNAADTRRLAAFLHALSSGVEGAVARTVAHMRKMRLSDVGQIKGLLLEVEGEPTGSYLVDVFDRVLQHEIEADEGIIRSARELNEFALAAHPPPYVAGSPDLQELVACMLNQNAQRLQLPGAVDADVGFADLLRRVPARSGEGMAGSMWAGLADDDVLLVITPACDLQRNGAPRILLLAGTIHRLTSKDWSYGTDARTPAVKIDGTMHWISWNLKHLETASWEQLRTGLAAKQISVFGRLRESHALNLQQRVLSGLGRVGIVSSLPATFAVEVEAYLPDSDRVLTRLDVPDLEDAGVVFIGRDGRGRLQPRLVLTEDGCDGLIAAIGAVDQSAVADRARPVLAHMQTTTDLLQHLVKGLDLRPRSDGEGWSSVKAPAGSPHGVVHLAHVFWGSEVADEARAPSAGNKTGVFLVIRERHPGDASALAEIRRVSALESEAGNAPDLIAPED